MTFEPSSSARTFADDREKIIKMAVEALENSHVAFVCAAVEGTDRVATIKTFEIGSISRDINTDHEFQRRASAILVGRYEEKKRLVETGKG